MITAIATEEEEGTFYVGGRLLYRTQKEITIGEVERLDPYGGIGIGFRQDKFPDKTRQGFGIEVFTGLEFYLYDFISINADFGVRYSPASLVGLPYRLGVGGGVTWYF
ncbi:MAG TPA: hypothetical protein EYP60_07965 [bacterium (Candidatus Stahlbacteria)]|nr:hypothetical protein [Candidatus Stahlbacteria bacterium]